MTNVVMSEDFLIVIFLN